MKKYFFLAVFTVILVLFPVILFAQNGNDNQNGKKKQLTVEELYLKNIEFQIMKEKAFSGDREMKLNVLKNLEKEISEGKVGSNDLDVEFILEYLAMEGSTRKVIENKRLVNYFPEVRRRACNLLGKLGGERAKDALITVLLNDPEPMVKSEAAYALGEIGLNKNGEVVKALLFALNNQDPRKADNNFAYAVVLAIEKIAKKNGGIKDPEAYRALVKIADGQSYIRVVRNKAIQVLDELKQYK